MKKDEQLNNIWKYVLLVVGGILILVPLLVTVFSSFKTTKDIMNHFFSLPNPFTLSNYERLIADGIGGYFWNSAVITILSQQRLTQLPAICQNVRPLTSCIRS